MTNIYILSKSYHELMFVFCSLFIGRQKGQYVYMCRHTLSHTHRHTLTRNMNTNTQHKRNALFCIILLYKMLEVHVFFKALQIMKLRTC